MKQKDLFNAMMYGGGGGGSAPSGKISITENGTDIDVSEYATADVTVPNTYEASDEGKVVDNGELVAQTSKNITQNGTVDTTKNNEVVVSVPNTYEQADEGKVVSSGALVSQTSRNVTQNGTVDTTLNNEVVVAVPQPSGKITIQQNGTDIDVSQYATADVNVSGGGDHTAEDGLIMKNLSGNYSNPRITSIPQSAFQSFSQLTGVEFANVTTIGNYAFQNCVALVSASFPNVVTIGNSVFSSSRLTTIDLPKATQIGSASFSGVPLTSINIPLVTRLEASIFSYTNITSVVLPSISYMGGYVFSACRNLTTVDISSQSISLIDSYTFDGCTNLDTLILRKTSEVISRQRFIYENSKIKSGNGYIYVPQALINSYKSATNWSTEAAQFRALEDYTVDGTTTGALDPSKI